MDNYKIPPVCEVGFVAYLPDIITKPPIACADPNEVYACAYGEARCDVSLKSGGHSLDNQVLIFKCHVNSPLNCHLII